MASKFGLNYRVLIQTNESTTESAMEFIEILMPFTIQFSVKRSLNASLNTMSLKVYNLSQNVRSQIFKDRFSPVYKRVIIQAGYGQNISTVYQGNIQTSYSVRNGADIITEIESLDGGFDVQTATTSKTFNKNISTQEIIESAISSFEVISKGTINIDQETKIRPTTFDGSSYDLIREINENVFIDNEKANILKDNQVIDTPVKLFNSETGLLGTPKRQDSYLSIDVLFSNDVNIGQVIEIESSIQPEFNGQYKVIGVSHSGVISGAIQSGVRTAIDLLMPDQLTGALQRV